MKVAIRIPQTDDLLRAYSSLQHGQSQAPTPQDLARYSQWARFDPRLAEIWVGYISKNWQRISPMELRQFSLSEPWPNAVSVLLEFVKCTNPLDSKVLMHWRALITEGFQKALGEQFFIGLRKFAGEAMFEDAAYPLKEYERWGYLAREQLNRNSQSALSKISRMNILGDLLNTKPRIRTRDYWDAVGRCISLRQAERDLSLSGLVRQRGKTKGKYFIVLSPRARTRKPFTAS